MHRPDGFKPAISAASTAAVVPGVAGVTRGAWATHRTAHDRAMAVSQDDIVAPMVSAFLDISDRDPDRTGGLATHRAAAPHQRRSILMDAGWGSMPGANAPDRFVAQACLAKIDPGAVAAQANTTLDEG
ncbi:hypothetical protein HKCCSP123_00895 [Rhodobacterales bacterium HKCCSP123]|nr:hypothetical protein [Rhodobacterales bacterium HKCCSP123]